MASDGKLTFDTKIDDSGFKQGLGKLKIVSSDFAKGATVAIGAATTALAAFGASAISVGATFEEKMSGVKAISGATGQELELLTNTARELGKSTSFSASEVADGMTEMAKAGWTSQNIILGMGGVLDAAAASGESLASVSTIVADAITTFGLSASDSTKVADVLTQAANAGTIGINDLGESFKYVGPIANTMGFNIEEVTGAITAMSMSGIKGSQAGTSLRQMLLNMASPTKSTAKAMNDLGIEITNTDGSFKSLDEIMQTLRSSFSGLTDEQKTMYAEMLAGKIGISGLNSILNLTDEEYQKVMNSMRESQGVAKATAAIMMDNLKGAFEELSGSFEDFQIEIFNNIQEPLRNMVEKAQEYMLELTDALNQGGFEGLLDKANEILAELLNKFLEIGPQIVDAGSNIVISLVQGISQNIPQISTSVIQIATSLLKGIGNITVEFVDAGLSLIESLTIGIGQNAPQIIETVLDIIIKLGDTIISHVPTMLAAGAKLLKGLVQGIMDNLPTIIENAPRLINEFTNALISVIPTLIKVGVEIIAILAKGLIQSIPTLIANIPQIIMAIINVFTLYNWASVGKSLILKIGEGIKAVPQLIGNAVKTLLENGTQIITSFAETLYLKGGYLIEKLGRGISGGAGSIVKAAGTIIKNIVSGLISGATSLIKAGFEIIKSIGSGILENLPSLGEIGKNIINSLITFISEGIPTLIETGPQIIAAIVSGIASAASGLVSKGAELIGNFVEGLKSKSGDSEVAGTEITKSVNAGLSKGKDEASNSGKELGTNYAKGIQSSISEVETSGKNLSGSAKKGLEIGKNDISRIGSDTGKTYADKTKSKTSDAESSGKELGTSSVKGAKESSKEMKTAGEEAGKNYVEGVKYKISDVSSIGKEVSSSLAKGISEAQEQVSSSIKKILEKIISDIKAKNNELNNCGKELIKQLSQGIETNKNQVNSALRNTLQQTINTVKSYNGQFVQVGANISRGIASGIRNNSAVIQQAARNAVQQAVAAAKKAGQIHSPSKLMANQIGKPLTQGIAVGMLEAQGTLTRAMTQIAGVMIQKMRERNQALTYEEQQQIKQRTQQAKELNISEIKAAYDAYKQLYVEKTKEVEKEIKAVEDEIRKTKKQKKSEERVKELEKDKELLETKKKNLKDYEKSFTDSYKKIVSEYENAMKKIESDTESLKNKLISYGEVVETVKDAEGNVIKDQYGNEMLKLSDLTKQIAQVANYGNLLEQLEKRGADAEVMSKMLTMSVDDAVKYGQLLMNQSDTDWKNYMENMKVKRRLAEDISKKYYKSQIDNLNKEYKDKLIKNLEGIPEKSAEIGRKSAEKIADGFKKNTSPFLQAIDNLLREMDSKLQAGMSNAVSKAQSAFNSQMQTMQNQTMNITVNGANYNNHQQAVDYGKVLYQQIQRERRRYGG